MRLTNILESKDRAGLASTQLVMGTETELTVVIGDLCPTAAKLALLRRFFDDCPGTRQRLHFEAISGRWERLLKGNTCPVEKSTSSRHGAAMLLAGR